MPNVIDLDHVLSTLRREIGVLRDQYDVDELSIFGSVSRGESRPDSDLDVLVKFKTPEDYDRYMDLKFHLERLLDVRVDLVSDDAVRKEIRPFVDREAIRVS